MSVNDPNYVCKCGKCHACQSEANRRAHNKKHGDIWRAPKGVREEWMQKKASEEEALFGQGWIKIPCPNCNQERKVRTDSLHRGFSCDKCGYVT